MKHETYVRHGKRRTSLNGATVSTALVQLDSYVNGMAAVVSRGVLALSKPSKYSVFCVALHGLHRYSDVTAV